MADMASVYRVKSPSRDTKTTLAAAHLLIVVVVGWLLYGGGVAAIERMVGAAHVAASGTRRALLMAAASLYFVRTLLTLFVFIKRRMPWAEVCTIIGWIGLIDVLLAIFGGRNDTPIGAAAIAGVILLLAGSAINTGSELQRHLWKKRPEHAGRLYTRGLFRFARHINYFGDLVLFTGWVMITGRAPLFVICLVMFCGFAFFNVPALDRYLAERYGDAYRAYARRTRRLIPFVY